MTECYTVGGDTLFPLTYPTQVGQTFRPIQTHTLEYVDIEIYVGERWTWVPIRIYTAGGDHKPLGSILSAGTIPSQPQENVGKTIRVRAKMSPYLLTKNDYYALIAWSIPTSGLSNHKLQYDAGDATYPRGMRISSADHGATWTVHYNDDLIFAEFGTPPSPVPIADPPIENFASMNIWYIKSPTAVQIILATSVPCHLTCYWTDKKPLKHQVSRIERGLNVPWSTYFCFVAWHAVEQNEPGDSLYHTFNITPWEYCETKWFTFRGEVDFIDSPSVGPIFSYHKEADQWNLIIYEPWTS